MYHVFLADDEPWALMALKNLIQWSDYGFAVSGEAQDGRQALERIERMGPDLIISDIRMPGMDGLALLQTIREKRWRAEVLLVSGYTDFEYARKALLYGCVGYLVKPVQEKELLEYLEKVRNILNEKYKADAPGGQKEENADGYRSEKLLVQNMVSFIQEHFAQGLTLQMLAGEFNRNESYIRSPDPEGPGIPSDYKRQPGSHSRKGRVPGLLLFHKGVQESHRHQSRRLPQAAVIWQIDRSHGIYPVICIYFARQI